MKIIEVSGLKKSYAGIEAVKGIDFYVEQGKLFAFLGPNGAGKSTTINMITTFLKPEEGAVIIDGFQLGKDDHKIRSCIGTVFQESLLDKNLSVEENLYCRGSLYPLTKNELHTAIEETIAMCELEDIRKQKYGTLSGGQRRRCDIARALLHSPKILFLDEPTTGLDPKTRAMIWDLIRKLQVEKGMSVFLTTHYMEEASDAHYIIVINHGDIVAKGTPEHLKATYAKDSLRMFCKDEEKVLNLCEQKQIDIKQVQDALEVSLDATMDALPILHAVEEHLLGFEVVHGTMDDAFLRIIKEEDTPCSI